MGAGLAIIVLGHIYSPASTCVWLGLRARADVLSALQSAEQEAKRRLAERGETPTYTSAHPEQSVTALRPSVSRRAASRRATTGISRPSSLHVFVAPLSSSAA